MSFFMGREDIVLENIDSSHYEKMFEMFIYKYSIMKASFPNMPDRFMDKELIYKLFDNILKDNFGIIALQDDKVLGYLMGYQIDEFKSSKRGVFTPEWAFAYLDFDIFEIIQKNAFSKWKKNKCYNHTITNYTTEEKFFEKIFWDGYGMMVIDAVSEVKKIEDNHKKDIVFKRSTIDDIDEIEKILDEHCDYMSSSPVFLKTDKSDNRKGLEEIYGSEKEILWKAMSGRDTLGIMKTVDGGGEGSLTVKDENNLGIGSTHVKEKFQNMGVGKFMIKNIFDYAKENNYKKLSVDFESFNVQARKFWLKYFEPVCFSMMRRIDDRV